MSASVIAGVLITCDHIVGFTAKDRPYDKVNDISHCNICLVLDTSLISSWNGRRNYYFDYRIKGAAELYNAEKTDIGHCRSYCLYRFHANKTL